jgi:hypothetical protein
MNPAFLTMIRSYLIHQTNVEFNMWQRIAPIAQVQTSYTVDLNGQITGPDPTTGNPITLNGNQ